MADDAGSHANATDLETCLHDLVEATAAGQGTAAWDRAHAHLMRLAQDPPDAFEALHAWVTTTLAAISAVSTIH